VIRIATHALVGLLTDLLHTADDPKTAGATAAIHLHTVRGYDDDHPSDLLVGTSTDRVVLGHANIACSGQEERPMLWPIGDVQAVMAVLKPLGKNRDHAVEIRRELESFIVAEDPNLLDDGLSLSFGGLDPADFPTEAWDLLTAARMTPPEGSQPAYPRTDFRADRLAPFQRVATRRNEMVSLYRYHQRLPLLVEIGASYRGVLSPFGWNDEIKGAGTAPSGDVYPLAVVEESA
jgi:hypothetical protein